MLAIFTCSSLFSQTTPPQNNPLANEVFSICNKVTSENRYAGNFPADSTVSLPIGIVKNLGGTQYVIAVDSARFLPNIALCSAYMAIDLPGTLDKIAFAAKNIGVNPKGVMSTNNSRLVLVSEHHIRISQNVMMILKKDGTNYIEWDCNGFKTLNLKGYFEFSDNIIIPDSSSVPANSKVTASFEIHTSDIHDFIVQVSITPFTLKNLKDISFTVLDATVDLSDIANTPNMIFPTGYQQSSTDLNMWQGFYLKQLTVKLPKELSEKNQGRKVISVSNLVIDNSGISGRFGGTNLLALGNSDCGGWQFSIDELSVNIAQNHLNGGSIAGDLKIPVFENNALVYSAAFQENDTTKKMNYQFIISTQNNLQATVFSAQIDLFSTSKITLTKTNGKFIPRGDLSGQIKLVSNAANTGKLSFENVIITSDAPYLISGTFGLTTNSASSNKVGQFPITLNQITVIFSQTNPSIYFQVGLNFMKASDAGFAAAVGFNIRTKFVYDINDPSRKIWKFDKVGLDDINLNIHTQAFTLGGYIIFREDDPVYGTGFAGGINFGLSSINLQVSINVIFGALAANDTVPAYKYFYVDGMVSLPTSIVIASGVSLYRIMGGLYYHMSQPPGNVDKLYSPAFGAPGTPPNYIPNYYVSLGFKAGVTVGLSGKDDAFNADVSLEVQFNSTGGLNLITLIGDGFFMTSIADRIGKSFTDVPVGAHVTINFDFPQKTFDANLAISMNYAPLGLSGNIYGLIHFDPSVWYVYIGTPNNPGNVYISTPTMGFTSYFMVGNQIEPMPDLNSILGIGLDIVSERNASDLENAQGLAFGARFCMGKARDFDLGIFTVSSDVNFVAGFDVMLKKFVPPFICTNTNELPGIKGWYAQGQLYACLHADVSVSGSVEVGGVSKSFSRNILSAYAGAVLAGQFIRPTYVSGYVTCTYSILEVLDGSFNVDFETGIHCDGI